MHNINKMLRLTSFIVFWACFTGVQTAAGAYHALLAEINSPEKSANCGVNVVGFTLDYFGHHVEVGPLAKALGTDATWSQGVNFLDVKNVLEHNGLSVSAYKQATIDDVVDSLAHAKPNAIALIHIKSGYGEIGHYAALLNPRPFGLFACDIGAVVGWQTQQQLRDGLAANFSGLFLLVVPITEEAGQVDRLADIAVAKEITINAGPISPGPGIFDITCLVNNSTDGPVDLVDAKGSCSCFRGAHLDPSSGKTIAPHRVVPVHLTFQRDQLGVGNIRRGVLLFFHGKKDYTLHVSIGGTISEDRPAIEPTWFPEELNFGAVGQKGDTPSQDFTVLLPDGASLGLPQSTSRDVAVVELDKAVSVERDDAGRLVHQFRVTLTRKEAGHLHETVTISTSDPHLPTVAIPIEADVKSNAGDQASR